MRYVHVLALFVIFPWVPLASPLNTADNIWCDISLYRFLSVFHSFSFSFFSLSFHSITFSSYPSQFSIVHHFLSLSAYPSLFPFSLYSLSLYIFFYPNFYFLYDTFLSLISFCFFLCFSGSLPVSTFTETADLILKSLLHSQPMNLSTNTRTYVYRITRCVSSAEKAMTSIFWNVKRHRVYCLIIKSIMHTCWGSYEQLPRLNAE